MTDTRVRRRGARREQILQTLAKMLELGPGERITTAALAREVGVSEAALYRHFSGKARMFESLIEFIEETLFVRINRILQDDSSTISRCEKVLSLILNFAEKNPGMTRLLTGDALAGETEALRSRISRLFDRLEAQIKQILREAPIREQQETVLQPAVLANLLLASVEGRLLQFVRSGFRRQPTEDWAEQWHYLSRHLLLPTDEAGEFTP